MKTISRSAWLVALLLLGSCTPQEKTVTPSPLPEVDAPPRASGSERPAEPSLCPSLVRLVDAQETGFSALRTDVLEPEWRWRGSEVPYSFLSCEIEGTVSPTAVYRCNSQSLRRGQQYRVEEEFSRLQTAISTCLAETSWYPRDWRQGDEFDFAGADRQVMWRDVNDRPVPAILLSLQESLLGDELFMELSVRTLR